MRIHELAKELGVTSKELLTALEEMGVGGRTASSSVPDEAVPHLRASGGKARPGAKLKEVMEEPAPKPRPRRNPEPKVAPAGPPDTAPPAEAGPAEAPAGAESDGRAVASVASAVAAELAVASEPAPVLPSIKIARGATAQAIADKTGRTAAEVVKILFGLGEMVSATQSLSDEAVRLIAHELDYQAEIIGVEEEEEPEEEVDESRLRPRPPVVTVMGHVDHGKTLLLDSIRKTDVVSGEFGGITQRIGAYQVHVQGREITFIDTPGHEAFTAMRARGARVTDIAVLVVAADDGVKPQTVEALDHARAAGVPIVVAINKVDKPEADPLRVRQQMVELGVVPSELGGTYEFVDVSAKARMNLDALLETILLVADLEELKADPEGHARGTVIDANLDKGRGPVASVLVQRGTLDAGDALVCGTVYAKIRAMQDENGRPVKAAGPSRPVQVLGWNAVPNAGDEFREVDDEREARHIAQEREAKVRAAEFVTTRPPTLEGLMARAREAEAPELNLVVKADVQGSIGALADAFAKMPQGEVRVRIIHSAAGAITESDIGLALASGAIVIGFNVRPDTKAREMADKEGVDVRLYRVIYEAIDDVRQALTGLLAPGAEEIDLGRAEVRALFRVPKLGVVAGCYVLQGTMQRNARARVVRDGVVVYDGRIGSLRRFKEDVREVAEGFECGIGIENFQDVKEGDVIETYEVREVPRSL
ncbi:MAG: translation initiation factor IF-2 [Actinomycetota bacterium]